MKTIKARIPAIVSPDGRWCAYGYPSAEKDPDWPMMEEVADNCDDPCHSYQRVWLTVELPVPEPVEVAAKTEVAL